MHLLLVRFSSMGDIVLQTATINWLRSCLGKDLTITFVTAKEFVSLLDTHPGVNRVIGFDRKGGEKWKDLVRQIDEAHNEKPIDIILDLHATLRSFRLKFSFWSIPNLTVDKRRWERFFLTKVRSISLRRFFDRKMFGLEPQVSRIIHDLEAVFGERNAVFRTQEFRRGPHDELTSLSPLEAYPLEKPYVVVAPSASFLYKRWPIDRFVTFTKLVLEKTSMDVVVLAGPGDDFCQAFSEVGSERLHNFQGKTSLKQSMQILAHAKLSVGNDSGMNHIAEAYGVPCVTIFGPTDPRFGFAPHGRDSAFISKELWCKPCSTTGKKDCFRDRHYCMEMISPDEVLEISLRILNGKNS